MMIGITDEEYRNWLLANGEVINHKITFKGKPGFHSLTAFANKLLKELGFAGTKVLTRLEFALICELYEFSDLIEFKREQEQK